MEKMKSITALALMLVTAASYTEALGPISYKGKNYVWQLEVTRFAMDGSGRLLETDRPASGSEYDPAGYIARLDKLEHIGTKEAENGEPEIKLYYDGEVILAVWRCDISAYDDAERFMKYPADMVYEASVFRTWE